MRINLRLLHFKFSDLSYIGLKHIPTKSLLSVVILGAIRYQCGIHRTYSKLQPTGKSPLNNWTDIFIALI